MTAHPLGPGVGVPGATGVPGIVPGWLGIAPLPEPAPDPGPRRIARVGPTAGDAAERAVAAVRSHAPLRRALARLAARWIATRGWERLGYARLADHARERLGLAPRQLHQLARVDAALASLPGIDAAFTGGALPWTRTRLLCRVATPADEGAWLAFARRVTARELAREVRVLDTGALESDALGLPDDPSAYPTATVRVRCSGETHGKWWRVRQLAPRVAGEWLPAWACMEAVVAETLSTLPLEHVPDVPVGSRADRSSVGETAGCNLKERVRKNREGSRTADPAVRPADGCATQGSTHPSRPAAAVAVLLAGLETLDAFDLDARLREAARLEQCRWAALAPLLAEVLAGRLYLAHGHPSFEAWVREELGLSPRKARALLRLERVAAACPPLREPWREGRLSWIRAQTLVPILLLAEATAWRAGWVAHAERVSVRRLEDDVERALVLRELAPPAEPEPEPEPERESREGRQTGAEPMAWELGAIPDGPLPPPRRFFFTAPRDVARLVHATVCSVRRHLEQRDGRPCSEDEAVGAMLDHALATWAETLPRRVRKEHRVFARDGWRCTVPGCTSYRNLQDHHLVFRSAGGGDELANRTTLCAFHHLRGVHAGRIAVTGRAPGRLRFALGLRPGADPLECHRSGDWREALA